MKTIIGYRILVNGETPTRYEYGRRSNIFFDCISEEEAIKEMAEHNATSKYDDFIYQEFTIVKVYRQVPDDF